MRTRYFGVLEGVSVEAKALAREAAARSWLSEPSGWTGWWGRRRPRCSWARSQRNEVEKARARLRTGRGQALDAYACREPDRGARRAPEGSQH